jgi:hypothetical protein
MIHVVADTTVYRADPKRERAAFRAVSRLAHAGHLVLHIPDIVRREFVSQQRQQYSKHIAALRTELHDLGRRPLPIAVADYVDGALGNLASLSAELESFAEDEFAQWTRRVSAVVHPIGESHGGRVVDAYFAGTPPFREPKRRDDFPDAFLWQAILDLAGSYNPLYVVSSDRGIFNAAQGVEGLSPFGSLEEFVASEPFQALLKAHFASANIKALLALLPKHLDLVSSAVANELVNELAGRTVRSDEIPDDNSEAIVSMVGEPADLSLDIAAAVDHGDGLFVVPFSLRTECLLDYAIFKGDFYTLPEEKSDRISTSELNEHYYSAEEHYDLRVRGLLSFEVDAEALKSTDLSEDDLLRILTDATISVDSIEDIEVVDPPENG